MSVLDRVLNSARIPVLLLHGICPYFSLHEGVAARTAGAEGCRDILRVHQRRGGHCAHRLQGSHREGAQGKDSDVSKAREYTQTQSERCHLEYSVLDYC